MKVYWVSKSNTFVRTKHCFDIGVAFFKSVDLFLNNPFLIGVGWWAAFFLKIVQMPKIFLLTMIGTVFVLVYIKYCITSFSVVKPI